MNKKNWFKNFRKNIHASGTSLTFIVLTLTQVPVAIKNAAEIVCIGQTSNKIWKLEKNHSEANMLAVQRCNGRK
tara:strand:+ start:884 stop:1105 length:222 start_codon:yes stop_codon:yes gene_type:complete